ncbi:MAG: class II fructose-bisphosphate aldolase [Eubacteriales bacterium]|nr:class II fructose-bisphosphate aldolase [Eubacteriales bacterium]
MALKVREALKLAEEKNTAVIAFECIDYNMVYAIAVASKKTGIPAIAMVDPATCIDLNDCHPTSFSGIYKSVIEQINAPIALHLDHCYDFSYIANAMKNGFCSVMYDGSKLSLEENIQNTKRVVEIARVFDCDVEAEIGHVGFANVDDDSNTDLYTKPDVAKSFCEQTQVTSLAIAIGSAHGMYKQTPKLDLNRLEQINAATDTPLVLHGGSGIPDEQLKLAFKKGINKFNVGTEYFQIYYATISEFCEKYKIQGDWFKEPLHILDMPKFVQDRLSKYIEKKLQLSEF